MYSEQRMKRYAFMMTESSWGIPILWNIMFSAGEVSTHMHMWGGFRAYSATLSYYNAYIGIPENQGITSIPIYDITEHK